MYEYLPSNLAQLFRDEGIKVVEIDGWQKRGRPASTGGFKPVGVLNHHTGSRDDLGDFANDLVYAKWMALEGRSDLPAPLCGASISAEGVLYLIAAGRANHAGVAKASGSVAQGDGNMLYFGIEWMLSGTQEIRPAQYETGIKANAVMTRLFGTSVQTISCHYQTSVTGKWDIGDPHGIPFNGHRVLNVGKFRADVQDYKAKKNPQPRTDVRTLLLMHSSLEFQDTDAQRKSDISRLFARAKNRNAAWITGTEAGPGAGKATDLLLDLAPKAGFRPWVPSGGKGAGAHTGVWLAVNEDIIAGGWKAGFERLIPGSKELYEKQGKPGGSLPKWGPRGIAWAAFDMKDIGRVNTGAGHYLTHGRSSNGQPINGIDHYAWNRRFARGVGEWATQAGGGADLAFYAGDQNTDDREDDTFYGSPLTSAQDELKRWESTGHGPIDVIASFDRDGRVKAKSVNALNDKEFPLNTDHFLLEAEYDVLLLKKGA